jgi:hypothetical protein
MAFLAVVGGSSVYIAASTSGRYGFATHVFRLERVELGCAMTSDTPFSAPQPDIVYVATQGVGPPVVSSCASCVHPSLPAMRNAV